MRLKSLLPTDKMVKIKYRKNERDTDRHTEREMKMKEIESGKLKRTKSVLTV